MEVTEKGIDGEITLTVTHVTIKHYWHSKNGRGTATYPLSSVTGVEFRPGALQGRFTLIVAGGVQRADKKGDPLTVLVGKKNNPRFEQLRDLVLQGMEANRVAAAGQALQSAQDRGQIPAAPMEGLAGQLAQLAALRDSGALTEAEFETAKAQILGRQPAAPQDQPPTGQAW